jgi:hypothetical protein
LASRILLYSSIKMTLSSKLKEAVLTVGLDPPAATGLATADGLAAIDGLAAGLATGLGLAAADGLPATDGLAAGAVVGLAAAVVGAAGAAVGLGAPPVPQALRNSANDDAPAASTRKLRIGYSSFRGSSMA